MKKLMLVLGLALSACDSPTVPERLLRDVYEFRLGGGPEEPQVLRWPLGSTVRFFVVGDQNATRTGYLRDALAHGISAWNNAALYGEVVLAEAESIEDADVMLEYSDAVSPLDLGTCLPSGGFAFTTFCLTNDGLNLESYDSRNGAPTDVKFVITVRNTSATDATNVRRLVTHEMGHVLGIAQHSPKVTDLMNAGTLNVDIPSPADRATLQVLYHTRADITP
jgi:predicted Zn-dependent protease